MTKIGISGFGRIGRLVFRAALDNPEAKIVGTNDPFIDPDSKTPAPILKAGADKVVITAPSKDAPMFVMGVNHDGYVRDMTVFQRVLHDELSGYPGQSCPQKIRHFAGPDDHRSCGHGYSENGRWPVE